MSLTRKIRFKAFTLGASAAAAGLVYPLSGALRHAVAALLPA